MCKRSFTRNRGYFFRDQNSANARNENSSQPYRQRETNAYSHSRQRGNTYSIPNNQHPQQQPRVWQDQGFPNQTVQPQLEAIMEAIFKQQQELTRITMQEIASKFGNNGIGTGSHHPSSY